MWQTTPSAPKRPSTWDSGREAKSPSVRIPSRSSNSASSGFPSTPMGKGARNSRVPPAGTTRPPRAARTEANRPSAIPTSTGVMPLVIPPPLELVGYQGGQQGAGGAEEDPGCGVGQPVGGEVGAGEPHQYGEHDCGRGPRSEERRVGKEGDDRRDDGDRSGDGVARRERRAAGGDQRPRRPGPVVGAFQRADQDRKSTR